MRMIMVTMMVMMMMTVVVMMMNSKVREANNHFNRATAYKKKIEEEGNRVRQKYGQQFSSFVIFLINSSNILLYIFCDMTMRIIFAVGGTMDKTKSRGGGKITSS